MTIEQFLGDEVLNKYRGIYPVLRLILDRMEFKVKKMFEIENYMFANNGGMFSDQRTYRSKVAFISGMIPYSMDKIRCCFYHENKSNNILISDSILNSERYRAFQRDIKCMDHIIGISTIWNHRFSKYKVKGYKRTFFLDGSIVGHPLRVQILRIYRLFMKIYSKGKTCNYFRNYLEPEFDRLNTLTRERISLIQKNLIKNGICLYITGNPNRIEELLVIMACKELGIRTREWVHHAYVTFPIPSEETSAGYKFTDNFGKLGLTDDICVRSKADQLWIEKYETIKGVINEKTVLKVTGSLEIHEREIKANLEKYDRENAITVFVPSMNLIGGNKDELFEKKKVEMFQAFYQLSLKQKVKVYIRFHPNESFELHANDIELCKKYKFTVLGNSRDEFIKSICISRAVFSSSSASLVVAHNYGCKSYSMKMNENETYDFFDSGIEEICIQDIPNVSLSEKNSSQAENAVNMQRLLSL